ncbi:MAG TPA: hypothetical protein VFR84_14715 [Candidatus Angelobacter sp.]|nr:hypothetical protein [Candidatus Angelobacter sp.]
MLRRIGAACDELDRLAEENPELVGRVTKGSEEHKEAYLRLKARLQLADASPRCRWVKQDGTGCGSPQMKKHIYCFAHKQMLEAQALALSLPALEDANAIQIGIMRVQKALIEGAISTKMAGLLLYSMQLALQNVGQTTFGQVKAEEVVRETVDAEQALSTQQSAVSKNQKQKQNQRPPAEDAEVGETLPLIHGKPGQVNAGDADQEELEEEFVALPGGAGYRFTWKSGELGRKAAAGGQEPGADPLPKGPRSASGSLEASTRDSALQAEPRANLG